MLKNPLRMIGVIFTALGSTFFAVGLLVLAFQLYALRECVPVEATVTAIYHDTTEVSYTLNDVQYTTTLNYYSSSLHVGDTLKIHCKEAAPTRVYHYSALYIFCGVFCLVGGIFFVVGVVFLVQTARRKRQDAFLLESGARIDASITDVEWNRSISVNGRCPFVVRCQAVNPADGKLYTFQSKDFWYNPQEFLQGVTTLPVYVAGDDYKKYTVDTRGILPEEG